MERVVDINDRTRVPASIILKQLRRKRYQNLEYVISGLRARFEKKG